MTGELPKGWTLSILKDLAGSDGIFTDGNWILSEHLKTGIDVRLIQLSDIGIGKFLNKSNKFISHETAKDLRVTYLKEGDVLISRMAEPLARACLFPKIDQPAITAVDVSIVRCDGRISVPDFIMYLCNSDRVHLQAEEVAVGTTRKRVSRKNLEQIRVPIPPLPEQKRIVAKLEKLLDRVNSCQQRLARIPVLLKRFRQSVLTAACSGRLTADWRDEEENTDEWPTCQLSDLFTMRNGKSLIASKRKKGNIPVYGGNGLMGHHDSSNVEGQIIVIGRVGAQCGNIHFINGKVWVTDNAISLQAKEEVVPAFYGYFLHSMNLNQLSSGTGQPYVSQEILGPIITPVVSIPEQEEIVRRVESLFSLADQIESRLAKATNQVNRLTSSILAKAFRGELVPQDPNDEPASVLLERIQEKRKLEKKVNK